MLRKKKTIVPYVIILVILAIGAGGLYAKIKLEDLKNKTIENLHSCLKTAENDYSHIATMEGISATMMYSSQIECHEKYKTTDYEQKVAELKRFIKYSKLHDCLNEANKNYAVSDEDKNNAGTDINALLILVKRISAGIDTKLNCHSENRDASSEAEVAKLKADKSNNEAYIDYAENAIKLRQNQTNRQKSTHCSSRKVGDSIFTDCY